MKLLSVKDVARKLDHPHLRSVEVPEQRTARSQADLAPGAPCVTSRQRQVWLLIARGLTNIQIGQRMFLGRPTIKTYISSLLEVTGAENRTQAASLAYEWGMIVPAATRLTLREIAEGIDEQAKLIGPGPRSVRLRQIAERARRAGGDFDGRA